MRRPFLVCLTFALTTASARADGTVDFNRDILPILSDRCFSCHGPDVKGRKAGLRLDRKDDAFAKLRSGDHAIVPGKSSASELVRRIASTDKTERMPPPKSNRKPLTAAQVKLLTRWVDEGAVWGKHWAYETPLRPELPAVKAKAWPRNPIDHFVLARLEKDGLQPSPEAERALLIRRVTFDLTGLPPTLAEIDAYLADKSPDAYEKVVDRLLKSPRYGERMAWDWLDAARYADSNGYQGDPDRTMWPWRDWVVKAMNDNMPYDRFTVEQIAGDLLPNATLEQKIATGFNRNHMHNGEGGRIAEETRVENVFDRVETTATVWLGVTLGCARCHDHRFDPFTQKEYFQLYDYFNQTSEDGGIRGGQIPPVLEVATAQDKVKLAELQRQAKAIGDEVSAAENKLFPRPAGKGVEDSDKAKGLPSKIVAELKKTPASRGLNGLRDLIKQFEKGEAAYGKLLNQLQQAVGERERTNAALPRVMIMDELKTPRKTRMLVKGAYDKYADPVTAGVPASLPPLPKDAPKNRLTLARWLVDPAHPLTARVTVNRYWQTFFGIGLVKTAEDFGVQGDRPSHPELLDWLATEFVRTGWDVKAMHRLIVTSAAYRQSAKVTPALLERDPENRLLARGARFRMPSWMLRDQSLALSGLLAEKVGGPAVRPYQPAGVWEEATFGQKVYKQDKGEALYRRSIYVFWRRIVGPTMFFDNAMRQYCDVRAIRTNTPQHALLILNDPTYLEATRVLAQRVLEREKLTTDERLALAFRLITARPPTAEKLKILRSGYDKVHADFQGNRKEALEVLRAGESPRNERLDPIEHATLAILCHILLNTDEALTRQ